MIRYPDGDPTGLTASSVMADLKAKEIHLLFCRITHKTDKMVNEFARHYNDGVKFELTLKDVFGDCTVCTSVYLRLNVLIVCISACVG